MIDSRGLGINGDQLLIEPRSQCSDGKAGEQRDPALPGRRDGRPPGIERRGEEGGCEEELDVLPDKSVVLRGVALGVLGLPRVQRGAGALGEASAEVEHLEMVDKATLTDRGT